MIFKIEEYLTHDSCRTYQVTASSNLPSPINASAMLLAAEILLGANFNAFVYARTA